MTSEIIPNHVAPFTGAWIEISMEDKYESGHEVAPFTGAWIEISKFKAIR